MAEGMDDASRRVYVGNLAWSTTDERLRVEMEEAGPVEDCRVMRYSDTGRSKGCAIVTYVTVEGANKAKETLRDIEVDGRKIFVREDREGPGGPAPRSRPARKPASGGFSSGGAMEEPHGDRLPGTSVFVGNLSWSTTWQTLKDHFADFGCVYAQVKEDPASGRSKGWGIVRFDTPENATRAIASMQESELDGRKILVREDREGS